MEEIINKKIDRDFKIMKICATSLFIFMTIIFIFSHLLESQSSIFSYFKAFSEAAMIGALADWFAVVALFRKPLGIPYHTAIIPNNKDAMGESLGNLVQNNFLTPDIIMENLENIDFAKEGVSLIREKKTQLLHFIYNLIPSILNHINKDEVKEAIIQKIQEIKFSNLIGDIMDLLTKENKHQELLDYTISELSVVMSNNASTIEKFIKNYEIDLGKYLPNFHLPSFVAKWLTNESINYLNNQFMEIIKNPSHNLRNNFNKWISEKVKEIKENKQIQGEIDIKIKSILQNKIVIEYFDSVWAELKFSIESDLNSEDSKTKKWIISTIDNLIIYIEKNKELSKNIDEDIKELIKEILIKEKGEISKMISKKIKDTPAVEVSNIIESYVGKDLQYIRINGTIVGGIVGLLIFIVSKYIN